MPGVTIPWWDWTSEASHTDGIATSYSTRTVRGRPNPLYAAYIPRIETPQGPIGGRTTRRNPDAPSRLPEKSAIDRLIENESDFLFFQSQIENYHGAIHVWVGGDMGIVPQAAYDPIFWTHHSMVDRIWYLWQLRHPDSSVPSILLNMALPPFPMTVADTLDVKALGYDYASIEVFA